MAANLYHEVIQVEVRDQSAAALNTVQKNVEKTESALNRVSKAPFAIVVKITDLVTRPLAAIMGSAAGIARRGIMLPVTLSDRFSAPFRSLMGSLSGAGANIMQGVGQGVGMTAIGLVAQGLGMVKGAVIGMNATLETSTLQFETLMGNADDARAHVADLFEFAKKTPFETQPVIDASRLLRTFGGSALDTMDNLTLFGDASAATSADIKEVSFWFGRAYAAIQAGQPFGEARMRLQELAILSPQAAQKLEALEKSGAKGDVVWKAMTEDLGRFNGAMVKQASTWEGLTSTLSDVIKLTSAKLFAPLFKVAKSAVSSLNDLFGSDAFDKWAESAGQAIADFVDGAMKGIGTLIDVVKAIGTAFTTDKGAIGVVYDIIKKTFGEGVGNFVQPFLQKLMNFIPTLKEVGRWLGWAFQDLMKGDIRNVIKDLGAAFGTLTGIDVSGVTNFITEVAGPKLGDAINWAVNVGWPLLQQAMGAVMSFINREVGPRMAALAGMLRDWIEPAWNWFTGTAWPALYGWFVIVSDYINNTAVPALQALATKLQPIVTAAAEAAATAMDGFNRAVAATNTKDAEKNYTGLNIVLQPLADSASSLQRAFAAFGPAVAATGEELGKLWGLIGPGFIQGGMDSMKESAGPLVLALWSLRFITGQLAVALEGWPASIRAIGPAFDELGTSVSTLIANAEAALQSFLGNSDAWAKNFNQLGRDIINGLIQGMSSIDVGAWIKTNVADKIPDVVRQAMGIHSPSQVMADLGSNMMLGLISGLTAKLPDILAFMGNLSNVFGGTDLGGWIDAAIRATGVPASWAGPLSQIIQHESGGNPLAANLTDINAQNNNASVGLMQLTGSNRATYTPAGMDPLDPIAQIIAGIRYIQDRYGDIANVPGVAALAGGGAYIPYDAGGILPPGTTLASNTTGGNEFVFTPGQLSALGGGGLVFAPVFNIDAAGSAPGVGEEISSALEEQSSRLFALLGSQLRVAFGNLAVEGGAT